MSLRTSRSQVRALLGPAKCVTQSTIEWYETAFKAFTRTLDSDAPPVTKASLQQLVVGMRQCGVKPISINTRSEEHTSELQSQSNLVCRLLLEKKKTHLSCNPDQHIKHRCPACGSRH